MDPHGNIEIPESLKKPFRKSFYEAADPQAVELLQNLEKIARDSTAATEVRERLEAGVAEIENAHILSGQHENNEIIKQDHTRQLTPVT